jgi:hypothetical protein
LFGNTSLSPRELEQTEAALAKAGLSNWEIRGQRLFVPEADRETYQAALGEAICFLPRGEPYGIEESEREASIVR